MYHAMGEQEQFDEGTAAATPSSRHVRAAKVAVLLLLVAAVFSYLGAFAVTNALVSADLIDHWPPGSDPRPRWMFTAFASLTGGFMLISFWLKWTSWRQLRRLDVMEETD